ncbi:MAG: hypothetical protein R2862_11845 [Thermoanaerobaculia bacterium]
MAARAVLQQQNGFNQSASRLIAELASRQKRLEEEIGRLERRLAERRAEEGDARVTAPGADGGDPRLRPGSFRE